MTSVTCSTIIPSVYDVVRQWIAGEGKDIELRHQRNPDVLFDSVRREEGTDKPATFQNLLDMFHLCRHQTRFCSILILSPPLVVAVRHWM